MSSKVWWLGAGLAGGVALTLGVQGAVRGPEPAERAGSGRAALGQELAELRAERDRARRELAEERARRAERERHPAPRRAEEPAAEATAEATEERPAGAHALTDAQILRRVGAFGAALRGVILGEDVGEARAELRALFEQDGARVVTLLARKFHDDETDIGLRTVIAHALAQSGDPRALAVLTETLRDPDAGMLEHRFASHGLAFADAEGTQDVLAQVARDEAEDLGARANASFGLARRGLDEGYALYLGMADRAMEEGDPAALQYLGGVTLLGEKVLPYVRERLLVYEDPQALLLLIEVVKERKDRDAAPNLRTLAFDAERPESVQKAARAALKILDKP